MEQAGLLVDKRRTTKDERGSDAAAPHLLLCVTWILVTLLTALGVGLRLAYLLHVPPFLDEYSSMLTGMSILRTGGLPRLPSGVLYPSGSLFSYLEAAFIGLFGFSDLTARLPGLLVSGLTLPVLYLVARRMINRRVALLSVALLAVAPEAVVWGGRARMYSLLQFLALLTVYFFDRGVLEPGAGRELRAMKAWPWVVCFLAAICAQDEAILLLPILWLAAWVVRGRRWFLRPGVLLGQVLLPAAGIGLRYWLNEIRVPGQVYSLTHDAFFRFPPALAHGLVKIAPFFTAPWAWPVTLFFIVALVFMVKGKREKGVGDEGGGTEGTPSATWFLAYVFLALAAAMVLVVNDPWQDDRYLFMALPLFLMVAAWGMDRLVEALARRRSALSGAWTTPVLVAAVTLAALPGGLSALRRYEPNYSAAYRWVAAQLAAGDLVAAVRPAPAAVYLGRCDFLVAEDKYQEFVMQRNGVWVDRWAGARVLTSPEEFRDQALKSGRRVWLVVDQDRFESVAFSPQFVALILQQMDLAWRQGGVLVFRGQGYHPPPEMAVHRALEANFAGQLRLTGYALNTDRPEPGQELRLHLFWQAVQPERNYTVFVHLVGTDGRGLTQVDGQPFLGLYGMTTHWPRDRAVTDERRLILPADTPPGRYRLEVGLYDADDPEAGPLPVLDQAGQITGYSLTLDYLKVDIPLPPTPLQMVAEGNLGGVVRLVGYDLPRTGVAAGATLPLTLTWEVTGLFDADYTVFVHLVGPDGRPVAQADGQPLGGAYPTRFWDVGERLADPYIVNVPASVPPGDYELRVGIYLLATGERLPLLGADGRVVGDGLSLGPVRVTAP